MLTEQVSRKHHFISKFYLARFTDTGTRNGRLCVLDLTANQFFRQKPKHVAYELDFNRVEITGQPPDVLETFFGKLEGKTSSVIQEICSEQQIPGDNEFSYVLNLIALFAIRNPTMRRSMTIARQHEYRLLLDLLQSDKKLYDQHIRQARDGGFISENLDVPFERFRTGKYRFEIPPQVHTHTELSAFENILASVSSRYWSLLIAKDDAPDFITCDNPVSLAYKQTVFPLDIRHALIGDQDHPGPHAVTVDAVAVAEVNLRMLTLADRQVYSRSDEIAFLKDGEILKGPLSAIRR